MKNQDTQALSGMDSLMLPFVYPAAWVMKRVRRLGVDRLPGCKNALIKAGVFPILNHYYEPQFDATSFKEPLSKDRKLPGIDFNVQGQLDVLASFSCANELLNLPKNKTDKLEFHLNNNAFEAGDCEFWYQLIRKVKPRRIIEIGSGHSTLMAIKAVAKNSEEDRDYVCRHVCIEPYEMPWLEQTGVSVLREKVEDVDVKFFNELEENDILFIDSSHIIRPQGDVLFEFLQLLPTLNKGVIVHVHDIFSPKNYPREWIEDKVLMWNEQYLLEAFLSHNKDWEIIGALNFLRNNHFEAFKKTAPNLTEASQPGSFYIRKVN